jgi:hypothetical protein
MHVSEMHKLAEKDKETREKEIKERKQNLIAQMLASTTGRGALMKAMIMPLKIMLDEDEV